MKKIQICMLLLCTIIQAYGQRTKIFSLSPMSSETAKVNGLVIGLGHLDEARVMRRVNGLNIDLFAFSPLLLLYADPGYITKDTTKLVSNGVNLAMGGFLQRGTVHHGFSIAMYSFGSALNGMSVQVAYTSVGKLNGLHISGLGNFSTDFSGVALGIYNKSDHAKGVQLGVVNRSKHLRGLQIGLFNVSKTVAGLQLGLWNENARRSLPIINF